MTTDSRMQNTQDFRQRPLGDMGFKSYKNVGKYFWKEGIKWLNTSAGPSGGPVIYANDTCTLHRIKVLNA